MAVRLLRSGDWPAAWHIGRSAALPANHRCAVGVLPLPREEFRQLEIAATGGLTSVMPCPSSFTGFLDLLPQTALVKYLETAVLPFLFFVS